VVAGAIVAAAIASVLQAFAAAIGLAVSSTSPTWRDASFTLWTLSGLYLFFVALVSYGCGAYLAGRVRSTWATSKDETEFRDGAHGVLVWALATLLTATLAFGAAAAAARLVATGSGATGSSSSVSGENLVAYDLDRLFRSEQRPADVDMAYTRAEAARILLTASGHSGVAADDRAYLARLTASSTAVDTSEAQRRVDTAIANVRDNVGRARRAGVVLAFTLGAIVAWFAAGLGGGQRDKAVSAPLRP